MFRGETSKPQYQVRPTFYIHATDDEEALHRLQQIQAFLMDAINHFSNNNSNYRLNYMYEDMEWTPSHLIATGWPDGEERIVR